MRDVLSVVRKIVVGVSLMGVAAATLPLAHAQQNSAVRGGLAGVVTDATGAVVANATVTLTGPQVTKNLTTGTDGRYEATGLTPGLYTISVTAPGFSTFVSKGNEVTVDHTQTLNATLGAGEKSVTVEVDGSVTSIDTQNTSVNTAITDTFYNSLPLPRNVSGAFYVAPGVVSGGGTGTANPSIGGSSGLENLYIADGVTITDQAYGGLGVFSLSYGSLGSGINLAFVKEVDVKTGSFEPKYGQADGGIVEIVTKSGSNAYHGSIAAYLTPEFGFAARNQRYQYNYLNTLPTSTLSLPQYELAAEFGGYVPYFRDKVFFFGAFDPTLSRSNQVAAPTATFAPLGVFHYNTTALSWAGKLTYVPTSSILIEASSYGDPSKRNANPNALSATNVAAVSSSYQYGTRNSIARINASITPWLTAFGSYSFNFSRLTEIPKLNTYSISDRVNTPFVPYGFGSFYNTQDENWQLQGELAARAKFFGTHQFSVGYLFNHTDFDNFHGYSGPSFAIPTSNAAGTNLKSIYSNIPAAAPGSFTSATFLLKAADAGCTYCATYKGKQVYLAQSRGSFAGATVAALSRYKAAYGEDNYQVNRYINLDLGLRWEQQAYGGPVLTYYWRDNWSPRLGINVDPFGDRKSKVSFSYSRYQVPLPLDAAVRQLGNEQDDAYTYAPNKDGAGNAILDATGAVTPNTSVAINGTQELADGTKFGAPTFGSSTGEGILPGTKMEYADEFILGFDREIHPGIVLKARYTDRSLRRIVEDTGSESVEGAEVVGNYYGGIQNVSGATDVSVNEQEVTYTPAQYATANANRTPGQATAANYVAPVAGCTFANDTSVAYGAFFPHFDGTPYNGACITNAATADVGGADGKPDGFADARRHYQAFEVELNRALRNHWQTRINYRYAKLYGNYEGLFRNDNGQSDPGITSLFDFTLGGLGLLGDQYKRGYLNADHTHVVNALVSYTIDHSTKYVGRLNGLTAGTWMHITTGAPISALSSHPSPSYNDPGEVPQGGRGTKGRLPTAFQLDMHLDEAVRLADKYTLRAAFDGFNVTDAQPLISINQNLDTSLGVANLDYNKPISWQAAFTARFKLAFEF